MIAGDVIPHSLRLPEVGGQGEAALLLPLKQLQPLLPVVRLRHRGGRGVLSLLHLDRTKCDVELSYTLIILTVRLLTRNPELFDFCISFEIGFSARKYYHYENVPNQYTNFLADEPMKVNDVSIYSLNK